MLNEADTRAKLIDPKLHHSGWTEDAIQREYYLTPTTGGRVILEGNVEKREKPKKADYLLRYRTYPVAIIEAKAEDESHLAGMQQAKEYAARAKAFLNRNQDFLGRFRGKAREIIELLVDKYRVWGIEEIAKPEVFRVRPLSGHGTFTAIADLFQRPGNLRKAVDELQVRLYAVA